MRAVLTELVQEIRAAGVPVSVAESIDAIRAASAAGIEREPLREALAAALVKDEADRDTFDDVFERFFSAGEATRRNRAPTRSPGEGERVGRSGEGSGRSLRPPPEPKSERGSRPAKKDDGASAERRRRRRRRELLRKPFREMEPGEAEEVVALAAELGRRFRARLARRRRSARHGRLDFRRTIRRSIAHGGVPLDLVMRRRRPGRPDLVALCDLSGSVRHAAEFFAAVLAPAHEISDAFAFLDPSTAPSRRRSRPPAWCRRGDRLSRLLRLRPDARRARRPVHDRVHPEHGRRRARRRANEPSAAARGRARAPRRKKPCALVARPRVTGALGKGDSAIAAYRSACDEVLACANAAELLAALDRLAQ